jgi:phage-related protein
MRIEFYQTPSGRNPVVDYIRALPIEERTLVDAVLEDVETHGLAAQLVSMRQIEGKLWELRIPPRTRIFLCSCGARPDDFITRV